MPEQTLTPTGVAHVPSMEPELYQDNMDDAIFHLENVDLSLRDAPAPNSRVELFTGEWGVLVRFARGVRADAARLRELADSIEQRVRATETVDA
jgi:hypothetical protein